MPGMTVFGVKIAIVYVAAGLVIAVVGGTIIEKMHMEKYVEEFIRIASSVDIESEELTVKERLAFAKEQVVKTFKKVFPYILIGVGNGAVIHVFTVHQGGMTEERMRLILAEMGVDE